MQTLTRREILPTIPPAEPTPLFVANAREIVANPNLYHDRPFLRALAWRTLMAGRRPRAIAAAPVEGA